MQKDILAMGTQNLCPKLKIMKILYIIYAGSFFTPTNAGVIHKASPITKNTLLKA